MFFHTMPLIPLNVTFFSHYSLSQYHILSIFPHVFICFYVAVSKESNEIKIILQLLNLKLCFYWNTKCQSVGAEELTAIKKRSKVLKLNLPGSISSMSLHRSCVPDVAKLVSFVVGLIWEFNSHQCGIGLGVMKRKLKVPQDWHCVAVLKSSNSSTVEPARA